MLFLEGMEDFLSKVTHCWLLLLLSGEGKWKGNLMKEMLPSKFMVIISQIADI